MIYDEVTHWVVDIQSVVETASVVVTGSVVTGIVDVVICVDVTGMDVVGDVVDTEDVTGADVELPGFVLVVGEGSLGRR